MSGRDHRRRPFWHLRRGPELVSSEVDEELSVHIDLRAEELQARGLPADVARREAIRQFGDLQSTRDYCRQQDMAKDQGMHRRLLLDELIQDLRIGLRGLLRARLLTLTIVATVGLGIGATTVIFGAVNATLLRPLPYADPERLVRIYTDTPPNKFPFSVADYQALDAHQTRFERIAGYQSRALAFSDGKVAERLTGRIVSWTYFGLLGITPAFGRDFTESDGRPGSPRTVIVSQSFWQQRLGGRADAIGKPVTLDGVDYTLTGVLPPTNGPLERGQHFFIAAQWPTPTRKGPFFITVLGRLRHGSTDSADRAAAASELHAINRGLFEIWKSSYQDSRATWSMVDLRTFAAGDLQPVGALALAAVGFVWLIACTNASNLLIARVSSRRRELGVRTALGASRARIVRYLLAESALLAIGAAAVGLALAWSGIGVLRELATDYVPRSQEIALDGATGWMLLALTLTSGLLFGLVPALHGTGGPVDEALRAWGRSSTGTVAVRRLRRILVGSQFAITTPLLVVAGLLLVSLHQLTRVDLGFDTRNLITGSIIVPDSTYREPGRVVAYWDQLQTRVEALPGVAAVAYSDGVPPNIVDDFNNFDLEDFPAAPGQSQPVTPWVGVSPEYFRLMGLTIRQGRAFDNEDGNKRSLESVIVDEAWATRFFPNASAVGKRFKEGGCTACPWTTVVGVVAYREVRRPRQAGRGHGLLADPGPRDHADRRRRRALPLSHRADDDGSGGGAARAAADRARSGSNAALRERGDRRRSRRAGARSAAIALDARRGLRSGGAAAVGGRHLRRDGVLRPAARKGHRDPRGARRPAAQRRRTHRRPGHDRGGRRRRDRPGRGAAPHAAALVTAVRYRGGRCDDVRQCHGHPAGGRTRRLFGARPASGGSRTGGGAAQRLGRLRG